MAMTKIMLIRHSEKPEPDRGVRGVSALGEEDRRELSVVGWQRAGALLALFGPDRARSPRPHLAAPDAIYACKPDPKSARSLRTVALLAEALSIKVDERFGDDEEGALAESALAAGGIALISWKHDGLPKLACLIAGKSDRIPKDWPEDRYDIVWVFDRTPDGSWTFAQVPQRLLPGDRDDPIA